MHTQCMNIEVQRLKGFIKRLHLTILLNKVATLPLFVIIHYMYKSLMVIHLPIVVSVHVRHVYSVAGLLLLT